MSIAQTIEQALAAGRADAAMAIIREQLAADPNNSSSILREVGPAMAAAYRALHARAVHDLRDLLAKELPDSSLSFVLGPLQPDLDLTAEWCRRLESMAAERLSNELLERVKGNDLAGAEQIVAEFLAGGGTGNGSGGAGRARQIGALLGGMIVEKERAQSLVKSVARNPMKFGLDFMAATDLEEEFARGQAAAARRERPAAALARAELTQTTVELSRSLPARTVIAEPAEEQLELFERTLRAIFRCALLSPGHVRLHEVTLLLVEFSPKEVSAAGALAGVEQRLYASLGRTARAVAALVMRNLGNDPVAWPAFFQFARHTLHSRTGRYAVEALGLFANPEAVPFLIEVLDDRRAGAKTEAVFGLGALADARAQSALLARLEKDVKGRVIEGEARREAFAVISALGRGARTLEPPQKGAVAERVIRLLPPNDTEFAVRVALNFFIGKLEGMAPELLEWAARVGTSALWSIDRPELARAGKATALGFRQPLLDLLGRLVPFAYATINRTALEMAKAYSGAYLALGEFYFKYPDPRALPVLRQLLTNTFLHDDSARNSVYLREQVLDVATEQKQDISKDRVIASLIYAIDKIGGDDAEVMLSELYEQIRGGRLPNPGGETADILMQAHMKMMKARTGSAFPSPASQSPSKGEGASASAPAPQITEEDLAHIADLKASYLLSSKRRAKKVAAMASLGPRKVAAAIPLLVKHLTDTDPMIAAAALTGLADMAAPPVPPPVLQQLHSELLRELETGDMNMRLKASEVLARMQPERSPLKEKLEAIRSRDTAPLPVRSMVDRLLGSAAGGGEEEPAGAGAGAPARASAGSGAGAPAAAAPARMSELEKKRQYMLARQEWIRGGKRGPEPAPPE